MDTRRLDPLDRLITEVDKALRTVTSAHEAGRPRPDADTVREPLDDAARRAAGRLMRVNHAGEVAAQALYQGQALTARDPRVREAMAQAAREEGDHLAWCAERCRELDTPVSALTPLWYAGSLAIGAAAGLAGDRWSLGFLAETERQVEQHLDGHLARLPPEDHVSRRILEQMRTDEIEHGATATRAGGRDLPLPVRTAMRLASRVMTWTAYRV
jgi:ubiquinone biosynthesis monooxygenase Coq7